MHKRRVPAAVIPAAKERAVAVAAGADPRTVRRWLVGERVRGPVQDRIARAVAAIVAADEEARGEVAP